MDKIRLCHVADYAALLEYDSSNKKFNGFGGDFFNDLLWSFGKILSGKNVSYELQPRTGFGDPIEGTLEYTGCIGLLQKNKSDVMIMIMDYPPNIVNVTHGTIYTSTFLDIGSAYSVGQEEIATVLSMFKSFSLDLYLMILTFLTFIWFLICIGHTLYTPVAIKSQNIRPGPGRTGKNTRQLDVPVRRKIVHKLILQELRLRKRRREDFIMTHPSLFKVIIHFFKFDTLKASNNFDRILCIVLSAFSFLVIAYFRSLIKTDLVVIKDPDLIKTWKDVVDREVKPLFIRGSYHHFYYMNAAERSYEHEIWKSAISKYRKEKIFVNSDAASFPSLFDVMDGKAVALTDTLISTIVAQTICELETIDPGRLQGLRDFVDDSFHRSFHKRLPSYVTSIDPAAKSIIKGGLMNELLDKSPTISYVKNILKRMYETGIIVGMQQRLSNMNFVRTGPYEVRQLMGPAAGGNRYHLHTQCLTPQKPHVELYGLTFESFDILLTFIIGSVALSGLILIFEFMKGQSNYQRFEHF